MTDREIAITNLIFYKPLHVKRRFLVETCKMSNATKIEPIHKAAALIINNSPSGTKTNPNAKYRSFWLGQKKWLSESSKISKKNNGGILITVDQEIDNLSELDTNFFNQIIPIHPEFIQLLGKEEIEKAFEKGKIGMGIQRSINEILERFNQPATIAAFIGFLSVEIGLYFHPTNYNHIIGIMISIIVFFITAIFYKNEK